LRTLEEVMAKEKSAAYSDSLDHNVRREAKEAGDFALRA